MHIISGQHKNRPLASPKGSQTRPTSGRLREALFNICQQEIDDTDFLDLFAGSGAMGLEALSRQARSATFVDNSKESIRCIEANIRSLSMQKQTRVIYGDVFDVIKQLACNGKQFGIIYADPPYEAILEKRGEKHYYSTYLLTLIDELQSSGKRLIKEGGSLFIEDSLKGISNENEDKLLKNFKLSSSRAMGRSALQHWISIT